MANKWNLLLLVTIVLVLGAGCSLGGTETIVIPTVAVLPSPTTVPSATPEPVEPTPDFAAVTPTLPPTQTPTATETPSPTPLPTATATWTNMPTQTSFPTQTPIPTQPPAYPTVTPGVVIPVNSIGAPPGATRPEGGCLYNYFFSFPAPGGCPTGPPITVPAAHLPMERGKMIWLGSDNMIYVLYDDGNHPVWERYPDTFAEGMPERDPSVVGPLGLWQQPRRGFGILWRTNSTVQGRLGWATHEWENSYTTTVQQAGSEVGGAIYFTGPEGQIFGLSGDQARWEEYPR